MTLFPANIDKEVITTLPPCTIDGNIILVDKPENVGPAVKALREAGTIGFDTETRPSFLKGIHFRVALLQLATNDTCYLFRLQKIGTSTALKALLEDPNVLKIGLSTQDDTRSLQTWMRCRPRGFVELQKYVNRFGIVDMSLQKIYANIFGERISKTQQLSNWETTPLRPAQMKYAAIDAWACLRIYNKLKALE